MKKSSAKKTSKTKKTSANQAKIKECVDNLLELHKLQTVLLYNLKKLVR